MRATISGTYNPLIKDMVEGSIVLQSGTCISLQALTTAVSVVAYVIWEEMPA